jgi:glycosyltransferase involved in cell wall biosynthesis
MTMRRAVVASDVGDLPDVIVDGVNGLLVPSGDPHALADALERTLADATLADRLGSAGYEQLLSGSGWSEVAEQVERGLRSIVEHW